MELHHLGRRLDPKLLDMKVRELGCRVVTGEHCLPKQLWIHMITSCQLHQAHTEPPVSNDQ